LVSLFLERNRARIVCIWLYLSLAKRRSYVLVHILPLALFMCLTIIELTLLFNIRIAMHTETSIEDPPLAASTIIQIIGFIATILYSIFSRLVEYTLLRRRSFNIMYVTCRRIYIFSFSEYLLIRVRAFIVDIRKILRRLEIVLILRTILEVIFAYIIENKCYTLPIILLMFLLISIIAPIERSCEIPHKPLKDIDNYLLFKALYPKDLYLSKPLHDLELKQCNAIQYYDHAVLALGRFSILSIEPRHMSDDTVIKVDLQVTDFLKLQDILKSFYIASVE